MSRSCEGPSNIRVRSACVRLVRQLQTRRSVSRTCCLLPSSFRTWRTRPSSATSRSHGRSVRRPCCWHRSLHSALLSRPGRSSDRGLDFHYSDRVLTRGRYGACHSRCVWSDGPSGRRVGAGTTYLFSLQDRISGPDGSSLNIESRGRLTDGLRICQKPRQRRR